jgi:hypothetical protein
MLYARPMPFIHYGRQPLRQVRSMQQGCIADRGDKPEGLWFSVGDDWRRYCEAERFAMDIFEHGTQIVFAAHAKILALSGASELDAFTDAYRFVPEWARSLPIPGLHTAIDWRSVAGEYDAVVIAPYCRERRQHARTRWYQRWDCASGCVWNAAAVAELRALRP